MLTQSLSRPQGVTVESLAPGDGQTRPKPGGESTLSRLTLETSSDSPS
jgi:hypothetical protein